jgi:hypothetical protein
LKILDKVQLVLVFQLGAMTEEKKEGLARISVRIVNHGFSNVDENRLWGKQIRIRQHWASHGKFILATFSLLQRESGDKAVGKTLTWLGSIHATTLWNADRQEVKELSNRSIKILLVVIAMLSYEVYIKTKKKIICKDRPVSIKLFS